ncbi:alpha/beta hydrolase [Leptolyngbya sp. 'hensonii']|uniref:alpha/beta fold hydrolase n=1 Tax=Leptolyngbya sp. 'hensonii' TaxID=1922337 RepID=UPI00094F7649|nr:alpha/beta hydrolase [Leptolyngbya sp. 'hensonii']OLP20243.1 alpha/beta hydrolase [Leptolyngbya sp. 'hensonii']
MLPLKNEVCFLAPETLRPDYPLFVFLPGMDGTGQLLRPQTIGLEAAFDVRCLSIPADDVMSWDGLTESVLRLVKVELSQKPAGLPVYLSGESFGGCLALKLILKAPELFDRLILINPASSFSRRFLTHWGSQIVPLFPEPFFKMASIGFLTLLASLERMKADDREELIKITQLVPQKTSVWRMALLREFYINPERLRHICQPTLIIASLHDRLLPSLEEARYLVGNLPTAQVAVLPDSGHACLLEADVNLYEILKAQDFLHQAVSV